MLSDEFISFLETQEENKAVLNVIEDIRKLIASLTEVKRGFSLRVVQLFMENDVDGIQKYIDFGKEIDEYINELDVLDIGNGEDFGKNPASVRKRVRGDIPADEIVSLGVVSGKVCPNCGATLVDSKTEYVMFSDRRRCRPVEKLTAATYECPSCGGHYIHSQMAALLDIPRTNIELDGVETEQESNTSASSETGRKCILCGQPAYKDSDYCKLHIGYGK